jgi:hypothetical protein
MSENGKMLDFFLPVPYPQDERLFGARRIHIVRRQVIEDKCTTSTIVNSGKTVALLN